jgi:hypothetical protein
MKTKITATVTLMLLMTVSGCGGPSPREIGEAALMSSIGTVILSIPIIMLMSWLAGLGLSRFKVVWAQFVGLAVISIGLFFHYGGNVYSDGLQVTAIISIISVPYLLLATSLGVLCLPVRICRFLPTLVTALHFAASFLLVLTNSEDLLKIFPLLLPILLWPVTICILLLAIGYLIMLKWKRKQWDGAGNTSKKIDKSGGLT